MTARQFKESVNADIRRITAVQVCNAGDWPEHLPESFEDWLKSNSDDIGGNWTPDKLQANHDQYDNDKHPFE